MQNPKRLSEGKSSSQASILRSKYCGTVVEGKEKLAKVVLKSIELEPPTVGVKLLSCKHVPPVQGYVSKLSCAQI